MLPALMLIAGVGFICWLAFNAAIYVVPLLAGLAAGQLAYATGAGWLGAIVVGLISAVILFTLWQALYARANSAMLKAVLLGLFCLPAAFAGYHLVHGLARQAVPSEGWQIAVSLLGALMIAGSAAAKLDQSLDAASADGRISSS